MKNFNLIKRLFMDSHEKQSPQRFARYAAMLIMLLTIGVGQMWGASYTVQNEVRLYVDNSASNWTYSYRYVALGWANDGKTAAGGYSLFGLSAITNTKLLVYQRPSDYGNCYDFCLFGATSSWGDNGGTYDNMKTHGANVTQRYTLTGDLSYQASYLIVPAGTGSKSSPTAITVTQAGTGSTSYTSLNSTQTIKYAVSGNGTYSELTSGTVPATITATSYKFVSTYNSVSSNNLSQTLTAGGSNYSATVTAARTATTTLTVSSVNSGYTFKGWYDAASGGNQLSASNTYTSYPTAARTIYARFEKKFTVTVNNDGNGSTSPSGAQSNIGELTGIPISASADDDYEFVNWTITNGTGSFTDATDASTTFYPTATATIQANFRSTATYSLTVAAGSNVGTVTGSTDPVTLGNSYAISASNFTSGYEFYNWTATPAANATFASSTSASTNVTVKNGSVTVTANAREIMRNITISGGTVYGGAATSTTAGVATSAKITANAPAAGKKFTGWDLGSGVSLKGGYAVTDRTIEIYSTANATVTANYADRASVKLYFPKPSGWTKVYAYAWKDGGTNSGWTSNEMTSYETVGCVNYYYYLYYTEGDGIGGSATGNSTWNEVIFHNNNGTQTADLAISNGHYYYKADAETSSGRASALASAWLVKGDFNSWGETDALTPNCGANTATKTISLTTGNKTFKIYNIVNDQWWRFSGNVSATKAATTMANDLDGNMTLTPSVAGPYTFTVGSTNSTPTLAITYPTTYTVTFNAETFTNDDASHSTSTGGGTLSAVDGNSAALSSGGKVISGGSAVITASKKDGYSFIGFYTNAACTTAVSGAGVSISDNVLTLSSIGANKTVYAKFSENMTTVNLVASPTGKGTFTKGGATVTSVKAGKTTHPEVTAVPATGYSVNTSSTVWATNNANITLNNVKANPVTVTGAGSVSTSTLTATFTPNNYTITLHEQGATTSGTPGDGGTITATYDATTNIDTDEDPAITAPERTGYTFGGYWNSAACTDKQLIKENGWFNYDVTGYTDDGAWVHADDVDLYAKWTANRYTVTLDVDEVNKGTTASATTSQNIYYDDLTVTVPNRPTATTGYKFDGYYTEQLGAGSKVINADGTWIASVAGYTDASKHWVHADDVTLYAYYKKAEITALTLDAVVVETNATVGVTPTVSPTPEGTTKLWFYVFHGNDNPLDPQPEISWNGTKATFKAGGTSGTYKIGVALRTGTTYAGTLLDSTTVSYQVAGTHSVTVRYKCGDDVIKAATTLDGIRPLDWSDAITAPEIIGYSFTGWSAGDGVTLTDDDGSSSKTSTATATIKIKAIYDGYLTANYSKKRIIYFNNTLNWDTVVVYFYKNSSYWGSTQGTGADQSYTFTSTPYSEGKHGGMHRVAPGSNIWYFDAEAAEVNSSYQTVAFTDKDQHGYGYFYDDAKVIKRDDYYSTKLPMFVPVATQTPTDMNSNKAHYYNEGYWMNYPENTGYTLKIYNKKETGGAVELKSIPFEFTENKTLPMELNVDLEAGKTYGFKIYRNDGLGDDSFYGNTGTMTANTEGWAMTTDASSNTGLQTTAAGDYKFILNYYKSGDYQYRVSVTYPVASGDYRLLYKDDVHSVWHPSAVIPKANAKDTVSFFVRTGQHAYLKLQKCTGLGAGTVTWTDTVTWWNNGAGIHSAVTQDSVYNICLTHNASTGRLEIENVEAYTGNYYIRVDAANSKWDNYRTDPDHLMTYSEYSITHGGYSHYYTHWVKTDNRKNIKFCIANDYSPCISDTLTRESNAVSGWEYINNYIDASGNILRNANVRFMWNQSTNVISRAYVDGAQGDHSANFLYILNTDTPNKIRWADESALTSNKVTFTDNGNWIYEANVKAQPNAAIKLLSNWGTSSPITQYFKGSSSTTEPLIGGSGTGWYDIRVIYDYKTNRLVSAWIPSGNISSETNINADVMFIREHQGDIAQLTFTESGAIKEIETAYGVLCFNKWTLNNKDKSTHAVLASPKSRYERDLFYVSFPFRVSMEDVFGFGTYGTHWIIEEYDGANRAAKGYWAESAPNWKFVLDRKGKFFEPNQGYIIALELDELGESSSIWDNTEQVELYFPSYGTMPNITNSTVNCTIPEHLCTINRSEEIGGSGLPLGPEYDRRVKDSHWNVISVPTYVNTSNASFANTAWITAGDGHVGPNFLYEWNPDDNTVTARSGVGYTYKAMHAYLVQYCGVITWTTSVSPAAAPRRNPAYRGNYEFRLEILQNDEAVDQTFVKLSDEEAVTTGFEFNYDLSKEFNKNRSNIYTLIGTEPAAGNVLPLTDHTTVVPVGVIAKTDGDYTFSIPDGTEGIGITLIDNETGIRTSLSAVDYTINLGAGTYDDRFLLEISPIKHVATDIETVNEEGVATNGARKIMIDGLLYIVKDGKVFDAQGRQVK